MVLDSKGSKGPPPMDNRRKSTVPPASPSSEELVASGPNQRNWRGIGIALLVIVIVCSLIVTAVVLLTPGDSGPRVKGERLTLDDFLGYNFTPPRYNSTWISDSEFLYRSQDGSLMLFDAVTRNATVFVSSEPFRKVNAQAWFLSPDRRYLLFASEMQKVFRYSFVAFYYIYDIISDEIQQLSRDPSNPEKLQLAKWGPVDNSLVFVVQNNIFYKPSAATPDFKTLTTTRPEEVVFNGIPDWVYEEEIISSNTALWFSKDGKLLCFGSFNDTLVPPQPFEWYGDPNHLLIYPQPDFIRYPKPGLQNPTVRLLLVNLTEVSEGDVITELILQPPPDVQTPDNPEEHYFTAVEWASNNELSVIWMNRRQNLSIITICAPPLWFCNESTREDMKQLGWVDWYEPPLFTSDGKRYLIRAAVNDGEAGIFRQVQLHSISDRSPKTVTMGKFEVTKICSFDEEENLVYYIAAPERKPNERQLYQIQVGGQSPNSSGFCLTCHLAPECLFVDAHFSLRSKYYLLECQGPDVPKHYLVESQTNKILTTLESSSELTANLALKALPQVRTFRVPIDDGYEANVRLLLPPELRDDEITKYPMVISVYGGPSSQKVNEKFDIDWGHYLASNKSYIYGMIDVRGSGFQGEKRKFELYRRLGTVEVEDQIQVTNYLKDHLPFVDGRRIGMWGWSYGGFVTAKVLATDTKTIKCGISVAPVTNWMLYDSVYTERYMGLPLAKDNIQGYAEADILKLAPNFKDKEFYLIHGTADDNVHFQQSMLLSSALAQANVVFRTQVYPDQNHGLYHVQKHLYLSMTDFFDECFQQEKKDDRLHQVQIDKDDQIE